MDAVSRTLLAEAKTFGTFDHINLQAMKIPEAECDRLVQGGLLKARQRFGGMVYWSLTWLGGRALSNDRDQPDEVVNPQAKV